MNGIDAGFFSNLRLISLRGNNPSLSSINPVLRQHKHQFRCQKQHVYNFRTLSIFPHGLFSPFPLSHLGFEIRFIFLCQTDFKTENILSQSCKCCSLGERCVLERKVASPDQQSLIKDYLESFPRREKASFNGKNTWSAHSYVFAE